MRKYYSHTSLWMMCHWIVFTSKFSRTNSSFLSNVPHHWLPLASRYISLCFQDGLLVCERSQYASDNLSHTVGPRGLCQMAVGSSCLEENNCFCHLCLSVSRPCLHASGSCPEQSAARWCRACHLKTSYPSSPPAGEEHDGSIIIASARGSESKISWLW